VFPQRAAPAATAISGDRDSSHLSYCCTKLYQWQVLRLRCRREARRAGGEEGDRRLVIVSVLRQIEMHTSNQIPRRMAKLEERLRRQLHLGPLNVEGPSVPRALASRSEALSLYGLQRRAFPCLHDSQMAMRCENGPESSRQAPARIGFESLHSRSSSATPSPSSLRASRNARGSINSPWRS
jgi:hypothetical protein